MELERRGHAFCRYADDANVYVGSRRAGERVMQTLERFVSKRLSLRVNRDKSAVDRPWKRKFLGYSMTVERTPRLKGALSRRADCWFPRSFVTGFPKCFAGRSWGISRVVSSW